jgi:hypothetical protein
MLQGWQAGAENILAHFRAINGAAPLSLGWLIEDNITKSKLDKSSVQYVIRMGYVIEQEGKWNGATLQCRFVFPRLIDSSCVSNKL